MKNAFRTLSAAPASAAGEKLGSLPQWRLEDLYPAMDSPEFASDLAGVAESAKRFAAAHRGQLTRALEGDNASAAFYEIVKSYEDLQDLMGKLMSFASLLYAGDTTNAARAKFYGDVQEKITDIARELLFFELEINRIDDRLIERALSVAPLNHYRPWIEDIRKERPHQLPDEIEQLFLEKSVSGAAAWN